MRKYFLLSAVALIISGTANAATDYAEVTAKATIEVAGTFTCSDLDFGTIVVKQGNEEFDISSFDLNEGVTYDNYAISISGFNPSECAYSGGYDAGDDGTFPPITSYLRNANGDSLLFSADFQNFYGGELHGTLTIPANVKAGEYTGSFTVTLTY
ncbi:MAG: DUF4402 domain-containing protein [Alphaproteobacteria bacterium]|nr:DUF4402 domain-containing protein [Alphaproteobacteria bacterium]